MSSTSVPLSNRGLRTLPATAAFVAALASAALVSIVLCAGVAAIAHTAGASHAFKALDLGSFAFLIVIGLLAATGAWALIRRRSADPARLLAWLVPTVVIVSFVPDVLVGVTRSLAGSSWGGVAALICMHLIVSIVGVVSLRFFLPLPTSTRP